MAHRAVVRFAVVVGLVALSSVCLAQQGRKIGRFRLGYPDGRVVQGRHGILTAASFVGTADDGSVLEVPTSKISTLHRHKSQAVMGGIMGAGGGLIIGALTAINSEATAAGHSNLVADWDAIFLYSVIATAVGGVIGVVVGSKLDSWKPVPLPIRRRVSLQPLVGPRQAGLRLAVRF